PKQETYSFTLASDRDYLLNYISAHEARSNANVCFFNQGKKWIIFLHLIKFLRASTVNTWLVPHHPLESDTHPFRFLHPSAPNIPLEILN
ncbi:hypothetical protein PCASD_07264, partial [Puccinia coronata f. sp. avenae]